MVRNGDRYGRLLVIDASIRPDFCRCICDCGNERDIRKDHLTSGATKSCGCFRREHSRQKATTHGGSKTRLYHVWTTMLGRCEKPYNIEYPRYGARGIKVCDEWHDFAKFREWALSNGYDENAKRGECTIDRINVDGDYCPDNCRFVGIIEQANNKRNSRIIEYNGEKYTLAELARKSGLSTGTLWARFKYGWDVEKAVNTPIKGQA